MKTPRLSLGTLAVAAAGAAVGLRPALPPADPPAAALPAADRVLVAEAFRLADRIGDSIWPGWARVPFALVLVTPDTEFFLRHPKPPADARPIGRDALLDADVFARPRTFSTGFLATFPIEGVSTVVVGEPLATGSSSPTDWVATVLHEHFHQLQEASPGFYERVNALGLSRGDTTGMWM